VTKQQETLPISSELYAEWFKTHIRVCYSDAG